ncbi:malto-oligosyltrehalose trehalohydrolase [Trebonia kvetii]|uniref:Malto-oligosyltrehalose trehalohydrolase n=1 Tax=Trebonia kvetii TaxID=2480626 RepID=A0A6P2BRY3_9ACTN|nr:malto-oligosyltrehalose trehalohydrolase [Trebonia kvetii]TVZ01849.1 malto-oligosyltrehalose trehalohydrolase [Trebonia kvetii]
MTFSVWAPKAERVEVEVAGRPLGMASLPGRPGWWIVDADAPAGTDYAFRVDGGEPLPDPRSLRQPYGPAGASRTYDHAAFSWTDSQWRGVPAGGAVIYELHVGTFTDEGTLDAAIGGLDHLIALGITVVELMPLAAFPGEHGWGYDGIGLWAVHEPYGGPDALKRFVDACHARGLAVYLDVVYNHAGPGNRLASFGPYFTQVYATPWGPAVNLDQPGSDEVRSFIVGNALMWLRDYHLDGLRLDAVHAFQDQRAVHLLEELAVAVDALSAATGRSLVLVAESDMNNPRLITAREAGGYGLGAQWDDDFHHAVHALVTGERQGYYGDFGTIASLAKVMTGAYFHDGMWSSFRRRSHGRPVDTHRTPAYRFVVFAQDHDQVGNRATGDRLPATIARHPNRDGLLRVTAGLVLTAPFTPMLFMGEEWGADTPWQFFTDHTDPYFADAVSKGRRSEFAAHGWASSDVPDPQDRQTFLRSRLDWAQPGREPYRGLLDWHRSLIVLRRARPELTDPRLDRVRAEFDEDARWLVLHRGALRIVASLAGDPVAVPVGLGEAGREDILVLGSDPGISVKPGVITMPPASFAVVEAR